MRVSHGHAGVPSEERGPTFSGRVWADPVLRAEQRVMVNNVFFEPGSRTYWHRHEVAQVLYVTIGVARVQTRDGHGESLRPGDVVHITAGEEHWHGAQPDAFMSHLAIGIGAHRVARRGRRRGLPARVRARLVGASTRRPGPPATVGGPFCHCSPLVRTFDLLLAFVFAVASTVVVNFAYLREHGAARVAAGAVAAATARLAAAAAPPIAVDGGVRDGDHRFRALRRGAGAGSARARAERRRGRYRPARGRVGRGSRSGRLTRREARGAAIAVTGLGVWRVSLSRGAGSGSAGRDRPDPRMAGGEPRRRRACARRGGAQRRLGGLVRNRGRPAVLGRDISTKIATQGGARIAFAAPLIGAYVLGHGDAAVGLPARRGAHGRRHRDAADERAADRGRHCPAGRAHPRWRARWLRIAAFAIVVAGAIVLARPEAGRGAERPLRPT